MILTRTGSCKTSHCTFSPNLTWRDVQQLIVETSSVSELSGDNFTTNGAGYNGDRSQKQLVFN